MQMTSTSAEGGRRMNALQNYRVEKVNGCWLTLNRACNLRCTWCYAAGTEFDAQRNMDPNLAHELIDVIGVLGAKSI